MFERIKIKNFRSLDVDLQLEPLTVLVGRSGTGKTNVVDALRFLRSALSATESGWNPDDNILSAAAQGSVSLAFEVTFRLPSRTDEFRYSIEWRDVNRNGKSREVAESLHVNNAPVFDRTGADWAVNHAGAHDASWNFGVPLLGRLFECRVATQAWEVLTNGVGCYDFPGYVLGSNTNGYGHAPEFAFTGLSDDASNYTDILRSWQAGMADIDSIDAVLAALRQLNPSIEFFRIDPTDRDRVSVTHAISGIRRVFPLPTESEGMRRFLAHMLAIYQTPPKQLLVFEEPEKGIHPGALGVLADEFTSCAERKRSQVLLTTHSPDLLEHFNVENIRVVEMTNHVTSIGRVSEAQNEAVREQLLNTGELLTVDPARRSVPAEAGA